MPSTGPVSLLIIGATQSQSAAIQATTLLPLAWSVTFAFLLFYAIPKRMLFGWRILFALVFWFLGTILVAVLAPDDFTLTLAGGVAASTLIFLMHKRLGIKDAPRVPTEFNVRRMIWRGTLGGCVVAAVVAISALSGPLVAGVFVGVPAIWSTSLYVTNKAHGLEFSRSLTRSFMRTGILTILPYTVAARYFFSTVGIWFGTLLAYVVISPAALLAWKLTHGKREARSEAGSVGDSSPKTP